MRREQTARLACIALILGMMVISSAFAANIVPNEIKMPGTQPEDAVVPLDGVDICVTCHGNYDPAVEPLHNWRGSMMAHASRDPIFWSTLAVAEQDFDGAGDLCIRCHTPGGWLGGRSAPTDGSKLDAVIDRNGIQCDFCHRMTNPDRSEHDGVQFDPFLAFDPWTGEGNYGSAQYVATDSSTTKLGPYRDANPPRGAHAAAQSLYHRSPELCGTCHDVSNPVTGDLASNNGAQVDLDYNGGLGSPLTDKVAFNYRPYQFGVVERTYSEFKTSRLGTTLVSDFPMLPADLQAGAVQNAYDAAVAATGDGNYADGAPRYFTCQTCHIPPVQGQGSGRPAAGRFAPPVRSDLPKHDLTGGNYWMPEAIKWMDDRGTLKFGGLTAAERNAMDAGALRVKAQLESAAALSVSGDTVTVVNLTGHKLISGYPEGRRMWLNIRWYDGSGGLLREDGEYGDLSLEMDLDDDGVNDTVRTLIELHDPNTRVYEVHGGITQAWAETLVAVNAQQYADLAVGFDRQTGAPTATIADVAAQAPGTYRQSFHFVLNNKVSSDTRIPPYGYSYDEAKRRNALPVPYDQYGNPGSGGEYDYWDTVTLNPPAGAETADLRLLYQPTSWEYVQFLYLANTTQNPQLRTAGKDYLDAWVNTGMAEPHVMATATWVAASPVNEPPTASFSVVCTDLTCNVDGTGSNDPDGTIVSYLWDFGDGVSASTATAQHVYTVDGTYDITLTVTDDAGAVASTTQTVTVAGPVTNLPPTASFTVACRDLACTFDGTASSDPDGTVVGYSWDLGDGAAVMGATATHTYAAAGTYNVTLTVTDDGGLTGSSTQTVTVNTAPGPGPGGRPW